MYKFRIDIVLFAMFYLLPTMLCISRWLRYARDRLSDFLPIRQGLYRADQREHDACGIGGLVDLRRGGRQTSGNLRRLLTMLDSMKHRSGVVNAFGWIYSGFSKFRFVRLMLQLLGARKWEQEEARQAPEDGDGAGILTDLPFNFFQRIARALGLEITHANQLAVGMYFMPWGRTALARCKKSVEQALREILGPTVEFGWRPVPIVLSYVGANANKRRPDIWQIIVKRPDDVPAEHFEERLTLAKKYALQLLQPIRRQHPKAYELFYCCSQSSQRIVYKGMLTGSQVSRFYADLQDELFKVSRGLVHARFATNTASAWRNAQPFNVLCHNGEINTLLSNVIFIQAVERFLVKRYGEKYGRLTPFVDLSLSDSGIFDCVVELLLCTGAFDAPEIFSLLMPYAWEHDRELSEEERAMWQYFAVLSAAWDGPAAIFYNTGRYLGARLDRCGYRPLGYEATKDHVVFASERGLLDFSASSILCRRSLGPGQMLVVDTETGEVMDNDTVMRRMAAKQPYAEWCKAIQPCTIPNAWEPEDTEAAIGGRGWPLVAQAIASGWGSDEIEAFLLSSLEKAGKSGPVHSMGDDAALQVLRDLTQSPTPLFAFILEQFAQVTRPPLDFLREKLVTSLTVYLRKRRNPFMGPGSLHPVLKLDSPILTPQRLRWLQHQENVGVLANIRKKGESVTAALQRLAVEFDEGISQGIDIFVMSDRTLDADHRLIPIVQCLGYLRKHSSEAGTGLDASFIADTAEVKVPHDLAVILGFGASAVCPRAAFALLARTAALRPHVVNKLSPEKCCAYYLASLEYELLKIMSKMGCATIDSYINGRLFDTIGLSPQFIATYLDCDPATAMVGGLTDRDVRQMYEVFHSNALRAVEDAKVAAWLDQREPQTAPVSLPILGDDSEVLDGNLTALATGASYEDEATLQLAEHLNLPLYGRYKRGRIARNLDRQTVELLQRARSSDAPEAWREFFEYVEGRAEPVALKDLMRIRRRPLRALWHRVRRTATIIAGDIRRGRWSLRPWREYSKHLVQPKRQILSHCRTSPMSVGSISPKAHEDLALAAAIANFRSASGEGGEDPRRLLTIWNSVIKQVASGRFGVEPLYLLRALQIEIKVAQGAKPGEGGQLDWLKVTWEIGALRFTKPHVMLTSPPPHHDIYSIEDLKQLILDLKGINPHAQIVVKLVASSDIGAIAVGCAKAGADVIHIAGHCGGTGNAPTNSIHFAGMPWEIGLALAHQALVASGLRDQVLLGVDGGLLTGKDVVVGAALGAQLFGFGTPALIALGCVLCKVCHLNKCPVGVATTDPELVAGYGGEAMYAVRYMDAVAGEVVVFGAYVRLTAAGLGCPDWPGCYGHFTPAAAAAADAGTDASPLHLGKAWREMIHRYAASVLGLLIIGIAVLALRWRRHNLPWILPLVLVGLVIFQGLLGMWTVTLLLKPLIVTLHLFFGLVTLSLLWWLWLTLRRRSSDPWSGTRSARGGGSTAALLRPAPRFLQRVALVALVALVIQIMLGGWTSTNYAAVACPDLPKCQASWWPEADYGEAFVLWRGLGINYEGGVLDHPARVAIHFTHRLGAIVATLALLFAVVMTWRTRMESNSRFAAAAVLAALLLQLLIGSAMVLRGFPLWLATAHNAGAALLLLATLALNRALRRA